MLLIGLFAFLLLVWLLSALNNWAEKRSIGEIQNAQEDTGWRANEDLTDMIIADEEDEYDEAEDDFF